MSSSIKPIVSPSSVTKLLRKLLFLDISLREARPQHRHTEKETAFQENRIALIPEAVGALLISQRP